MNTTKRYLVLGICCISLFIIGIDTTIVNIALPAIRREFNASVSGLQWTIDAYTLVLASLLILSGSTADRIGRRRTFQTGLAIFTLGSLLCGIAPGLGWLVAFRMLQAVGGSMLNPVAMSIITNTFTDRAERARAIGIWAGVVGLSMALGPVVGGALIDSVSWRAIFWINVPVGLAALALTAVFVPESRAPRPRRLDPFGQVLVLTALATLTYAIIEGPNAGWRAPEIIGGFTVAAIALALLLWWEPRRPEPLIELRFFRSASFSGAIAVAVCAFAAFGGFLFLNTVYLQEVRGYSALRAGLYTLPIAAMTALLSPFAGRLVASRGPRLPLMIAGAGLAGSVVPLIGLTNESSTGRLLTAYFLFGLGFSMLNAPVTNAAVSGMPAARAGVAAGIASTSRQTGMALGIAVIGSAVTSSLAGSLRASFATASHVGWWIVMGCGLTVLVLGIVTTGRWAERTAARMSQDEIFQEQPV